MLYETDSEYEHYQVFDMVYEGRPARVLFSGQQNAALSGVPKDADADLLFDYNQRMLELAQGLQPKRILVIGGGVYTLPSVLLTALPAAQLDVIEMDSALDDIARRYFGWQPSSRANIIHADGRQVLEATKSRYDLILIDAFMRLEVPKSLSDSEAVKHYKRILSPGGVVALNIIAPYRGLRSKPLRRQFDTYNKVFGNAAIFPVDSGVSLWVPQNFLVISYKGRPQTFEYLRFEPLQPYS